MKQLVRSLWGFVRCLATDNDYERYLEHHRRSHGDAAPLDRRAFYLRQQQNKWSGVQRCC